jgi:L-aspartate oxidase
MKRPPFLTFDVLVIGSGLAGMSLALRLADHYKVALVTKKSPEDSASAWAQGGIAAVLDAQDTVDAHIADTLIAGAGLCDPTSTRFVIEHSREAVEWLLAQGVPFTADDSSFGYHLTREGGHSQRRIIHAADATGAAVQATLLAKIQSHPSITLLDHHLTVDLITGRKLGLSHQRCLGAYVLDVTNDQVLTLGASFTVLATGGAGKAYLYTTNPDTSTGDGIAMAWRAGCRVANLEFVQFHPTCLYHPQARTIPDLGGGARRGRPFCGCPTARRFMPDHDRARLNWPRGTSWPAPSTLR